MLLLGLKKKCGSVYVGDDRKVVTMVDVSDCYVASKKESIMDQVIVSVGIGKKRRPIKSQVGVFKKLGFVPRKIMETKVDTLQAKSMNIGASLDDVLVVGTKVYVTAISKGKGFAGVVKRWGFHGANASHGVKDKHRHPGSIGTQGMDRVWRGKKMAGRMGSDQITLKNRLVLAKESIDGKTYLLIQGTIPGSYNSLVELRFENIKNESTD